MIEVSSGVLSISQLKSLSFSLRDKIKPFFGLVELHAVNFSLVSLPSEGFLRSDFSPLEA